MNIPTDIWEKWAKLEMLVKVGNGVLGISKRELKIDQMDQTKS